MDPTVRELADALFMQSVLSNNAECAQETRATKSAMVSRGPIYPRVMVGLSAKFFGRNLEARLKSFQEAFAHANARPTLEDVDEIWSIVKAEYESKLKSSARSLDESPVRDRSADGSAAHFTSLVARDHDRVLQAWKVWRGQIKTTANAGSDAFALKSIPTIQELLTKKDLLEDLGRALSRGQHIGVLFLDLDNFKAVNDTLGHAEGDRCLETVTQVVGSAVVHKGRMYRVGGDEFVMVLPNFDEAEVTATAERIRASIDRSNPGGTVKVTCSIGAVVANQETHKSAADVFEAADQAMYRVKRGQKNGVSIQKAREA